MAGIETASAVIGVAQVGFSLARTLNTYIGDFKDSRESIITLASELDATIIQVQELNSLVANNKSIQTAQNGSLKLAEKCVKDSDRLIKKLVQLLTKAHLPEDPKAIVNIKPEDIIVSKLTRAYWPLVKPQVDVVKSELHVMKTDILIARSCIQAQSGSTPADRAAGSENIVALAKSKHLARRLLREAKAEEQRSAMARYLPDPTAYSTAGDLANTRPSRLPVNSPGFQVPPYRSGIARGSYDDAKDTEAMARDLRDSIIYDLHRKEVEQKEKEAEAEKARQQAVELYQATLKERLSRLQEQTDTTRRQMKEIFGANLNEERVKEFLEEQRSRQLQDELGETLLKLGVGSLQPQKDPQKSSQNGSESGGSRSSKRRWFFNRSSSRSSLRSDARHSLRTPGYSDASSQPSTNTRFLHIVSAYDAAEGKYNCQTFENPAMKHHPCGTFCDLEMTMKAWQAVPDFIKHSTAKWVNDTFPDRVWHLHAALPIEKDVRKSRRLLQKAVLGASLYQGMSSILLVYSSSEPQAASEVDMKASITDSASDAYNASAPAPESTTSRVELSQTDVEQMREWLTNKGLSTDKIAQLESLVAKPKPPPDGDEPTVAAAAVDGMATVEQSKVDKDQKSFALRSRSRSRLDELNPRAAIEERTPYSAAYMDLPPPPPPIPAYPALYPPSRVDTYDRYVPLADRSPYDYDPFESGLSAPGIRSRREGSRLEPPPAPRPAGSYDEWLYSGQKPRERSIRFADDEDFRHRPRRAEMDIRKLEEDILQENVKLLAERRVEQRLRDDAMARNGRPTEYMDRRRERTPSPPPPPRSQYYGTEVGLPSRTRDYSESAIYTDRPITTRSRGRSGYRSVSPQNPYAPREHAPHPVINVYNSHVPDTGREEDMPYRPDHRFDRSNRHNHAARRSSLAPIPVQGSERPYSNPEETLVTRYRVPERLRSGSYNEGKFSLPQQYNFDIDVPARTRSPEEIQDDASDAEDAMLDDEELKNKMLIKYTSGIAFVPPSKEPQSGTRHSISDSGTAEEPPARETLPESSIHISEIISHHTDKPPQRKYTATIEEVNEAEEKEVRRAASRDSSPWTRARVTSSTSSSRSRSRRRRSRFDADNESAKSTPDRVSRPVSPEPMAKDSGTESVSGTRSTPAAADEPLAPVPAGEPVNYGVDDSWGSFSVSKKKKKKKKATPTRERMRELQEVVVVEEINRTPPPPPVEDSDSGGWGWATTKKKKKKKKKKDSSEDPETEAVLEPTPGSPRSSVDEQERKNKYLPPPPKRWW